ncbi:efflux RND transporter permease subunit [Pseudomonas sp. ML2-2023-6]|uniref:efflux RND transporter permease subunit n=1 Tax=Pseudomonas sp. ML2-2023-6 TaxID=3122376 RepID=UPI0030CAE60F
MNFQMSSWAIRQPIPTLVLFLLLAVVGISAFIDLPSRALLTTPGVQRVQRMGGVNREILIELKPDRLAALGISAEQVNTQLVQSNVDVPGGRIILYGREQTIRTLGSAASVEALATRPISLPGARWATLGDLATVRDASSESRELARLNGREVVGFPVVFTYMDDLRMYLAQKLTRLTSVTEMDRKEDDSLV